MRIVIYIFALIGLLFVIGASYSAYQVFSFKGFSISSDGSLSVSSNGFNDHFSDYIYFDHEVSNSMADLPVPPAGDAEMYGEIMKDGLPVEGISLVVFLNAKYKTETLVTDANGRFSFSVTPGDWAVNLIIIDGWKNKPEGDYVVVTGLEDKFKSRNYNYREKSSSVNVASNESVKIAGFEINKQLSMTSPVDRPQLSEVGDFSISWEPHSKASSYIVSIASVKERSDSSSTSFVIGEKSTTDSSILLSEWDSIEDEGEPNVYRVDIVAFDDAGTFVSETQQWSAGKFELANYKILEQKTIEAVGLAQSVDDYEEYYQNQKRITASEFLIEEGLLDEAEKVINLITESAQKGKKEALLGYLHATRDQCDVANSYFDQALKIGGQSCLPTSYRSACN